MASFFLELVEKSDGDIVLQRSDEDGGEPVVCIRFSRESRGYLGDGALEVARAMVQAGIQAAAQMAEQGDIEVSEKPVPDSPRILH